MYKQVEHQPEAPNGGDAFLSNEEVEDLVDNFRNTIENMTIEGEHIKPKLEEGRAKLENLKVQKQKLDSEMSEFNSQINLYQPQIEKMLENQKGYYQMNQQINGLFKKYKIGEERDSQKSFSSFEKAVKSEPLIEFEERKEEKETKNYHLDKDYQNIDKILKSADNKLSQQEKDSLQSALQMYINESEAFEKNSTKLERLIQDSLDKREEVLRKEAKLFTIQYCIHCKLRFSPLCNEEGSCVFHTGKLKFYSCRTCGCDEYYSCCSKCLKCSKGCASGKHAQKEKVFRNEITPQSKPSKSMSLTNINDSDFYQITYESLQFLPKKI